MAVFLPAYKDTFYEYSGNSLSFYIRMRQLPDEQYDEEYRVIYEGKAYRNPDEPSIRININRIAKDYLENHIEALEWNDPLNPADRWLHIHYGSFVEFELFKSDGTLLETYGILFAWDGDFDGSTKLLSDPIRPNISNETPLPFSVYSPNGDDFYIDFGPATRNTFFNLITTNLSVNNAGGRSDIQWLTDYYPFTDIDFTSNIGAIQGFGNRGPSGATIWFKESPTPAPRTFTVTVYYQNTSNVLGTINVLQSSIDFNLVTKTLNVPPNGGTYQIRWVTEIDPAYLSAEVEGWPGTTVTGINSYGCTITVPRSMFPNNYPFKVNFYYEWDGDRYLLDTTNVNLRGNSDMTTGSTIDSAVTRDVLITEEGLFMGFNSGGVMIWRNVDTDYRGYYPSKWTQYFSNLFNASPVEGYGLGHNVSLCRKEPLCEYNRTYEIEGYKLSGSTEWLNEYLEQAKNYGCLESQDSETYTGDTMRTGTLYLYSGDTILDAVVVVQPPYKAAWYNYPIDSGDTPYTFSDFKFKSTGFTESALRTVLSRSIPAYSRGIIFDGVKVFIDSGTNYLNWSDYQHYGDNAFTLETGADGWTTVKTPLPINEIATLSGVPATEVWISRNVKILRTFNENITAVTYEGTKQDLRNVKISVGSSVPYIQCSDGTSMGFNSDWKGKSDPLVLEGNEIRPAMCDEYFYVTDDPEPSNVVEITFTGSTTTGTGYNYFFGLNGNILTANTVTTGMSGEYATATLTFDEDVYGARRLYSGWRSIDSSVRYIYCENSTASGAKLIEPIEKARILGNYTYSGNTNLQSELTFKNLRGIVGRNNFAGTPVTKLEAHNLITLGVSALTGSIIEELYLPSVQTLASYSIPEYCTKLTVGKSLNNVSTSAFSGSQYLTALDFEGSLADWAELNTMVSVETTLKLYSNVDRVVCTDGDKLITR